MCPDLCNNKSELRKTLYNNAQFYEQQHDQHQSVIENMQMTEITPYLYLGNELDAKNVQKLTQLGVLYILNVTKNIPFYDQPTTTTTCSSSSSSNSSKFVFKRIPVNDCLNQNLKEYFEEAFDFIGWLFELFAKIQAFN